MPQQEVDGGLNIRYRADIRRSFGMLIQLTGRYPVFPALFEISLNPLGNGSSPVHTQLPEGSLRVRHTVPPDFDSRFDGLEADLGGPSWLIPCIPRERLGRLDKLQEARNP